MRSIFDFPRMMIFRAGTRPDMQSLHERETKPWLTETDAMKVSMLFLALESVVRTLLVFKRHEARSSFTRLDLIQLTYFSLQLPVVLVGFFLASKMPTRRSIRMFFFSFLFLCLALIAVLAMNVHEDFRRNRQVVVECLSEYSLEVNDLSAQEVMRLCVRRSISAKARSVLFATIRVLLQIMVIRAILRWNTFVEQAPIIATPPTPSAHDYFELPPRQSLVEPAPAYISSECKVDPPAWSMPAPEYQTSSSIPSSSLQVAGAVPHFQRV